MPEDVGFYDELTGAENLMYTARLNRIPDKVALQKADESLNRGGMADAWQIRQESISVECASA